MSKLYIAFGSNLSKKQMRARCPTARALGKFMLTSAQLVFRGVADLEFIPGAQTPCGLYSLNEADERALDRYEGVSTGAYFKSEQITLNYAGRKRKALIYLMNSDAIYPPSQEYVDRIRKGYKDFGLEEKYLEDAIKRSFVDRNPDEATRARRARQRASDQQRQLVAVPEALRSKVKLREVPKAQPALQPIPKSFGVPSAAYLPPPMPERQLDLLTPEETYTGPCAEELAARARYSDEDYDAWWRRKQQQ